MEFGISGKTAFITGGSRGIGNASALALANEGVNIAICARNEDGIEEAVKKIKSFGVEAYGITSNYIWVVLKPIALVVEITILNVIYIDL